MKSIYFFAVNRHQLNYFSKLAKNFEEAEIAKCEVIHLGRRRSIPLRHVVQSWNTKVITRSATLRWKGYYQEHKKLPFLLSHLRLFFYFITAWFRYAQAISLLKANLPDAVILWNGSKWHQFMVKQIAQDCQVKTIFFENGGLPDTTTVDDKGVNAENSVPRFPEFYRQYQAVNSMPQNEIKLEVRQQKISRQEKSLGEDEKQYIFVPFQVDSDTQILLHSPWIKNMEQLWQLLDGLTEQLSVDQVFVVKEHPSSVNDYSYLHDRNPKILFSTDSTQQLIEQAQQVWTINSSVGLEAILIDKPVVVLGDAFYAIPGVAQTVKSSEELSFLCSQEPLFDQKLRKQFLNYLRSEYYLPGNWRSESKDHFVKVVERVSHYLTCGS